MANIAQWLHGAAVVSVMLVVLAACSKSPSSGAAGAPAGGAAAKSAAAGASAAAPPPPKVDVMQVIQRDATVTGELVGTVSAVREVPLRSQVTGTLQKILFDAGQRVHVGQLLFVVD